VDVVGENLFTFLIICLGRSRYRQQGGIRGHPHSAHERVNQLEDPERGEANQE